MSSCIIAMTCILSSLSAFLVGPPPCRCCAKAQCIRPRTLAHIISGNVDKHFYRICASYSFRDQTLECHWRRANLEKKTDSCLRALVLVGDIGKGYIVSHNFLRFVSVVGSDRKVAIPICEEGEKRLDIFDSPFRDSGNPVNGVVASCSGVISVGHI